MENQKIQQEEAWKELHRYGCPHTEKQRYKDKYLRMISFKNLSCTKSILIDAFMLAALYYFDENKWSSLPIYLLFELLSQQLYWAKDLAIPLEKNFHRTQQKSLFGGRHCQIVVISWSPGPPLKYSFQLKEERFFHLGAPGSQMNPTRPQPYPTGVWPKQWLL